MLSCKILTYALNKYKNMLHTSFQTKCLISVLDYLIYSHEDELIIFLINQSKFLSYL